MLNVINFIIYFFSLNLAVPFKMKEFKNVPSKLYEKTNDWITKEKNLTKTKYTYPETKPKQRRIMSASHHRILNLNGEPPHFVEKNIQNFEIFKKNNNESTSMFDNYYHNKMVEKKLIPSPEEEKALQKKEDLDYQFEAHLRELRSLNNIESQISEQYESIKKAKLKPNTPSINDKGIILQKSNKNYIEENKQKIIKGEINKKSNINNFNKSTQNPYHKDYGKTPQYLKNMKLEAERQKELDKLKREQDKYPKGTRLLSEDERLLTLNKLLESKKDIENLVNKLPITMSSQAVKNKQEELYKKLDELDKAIATFSRKKVFVKIDT